MINALALAIACLLLGAYWWSIRTDRRDLFDWANVVLGPILCGLALVVGAWGHALLSLGWFFIALNAICYPRNVDPAERIESYLPEPMRRSQPDDLEPPLGIMENPAPATAPRLLGGRARRDWWENKDSHYTRNRHG